MEIYTIMERISVYSPEAPKPIGPYSQAVEAGGFVFCSGQIPIDPQTGHIIVGSIHAQTERILMNLRTILEAAGSSLEQTVKMTVYLTDLADFENLNQVLGKHFPQEPPARAVVQVSALPKNAMVEIDLIALKK
jgi:2-iminobutanoate/2-iminopropanoate deaminase